MDADDDCGKPQDDDQDDTVDSASVSSESYETSSEESETGESDTEDTESGGEKGNLSSEASPRSTFCRRSQICMKKTKINEMVCSQMEIVINSNCYRK